VTAHRASCVCCRPPEGHGGGSVRLDGKELLTLPEAEMRRVRGARIAMIFQEPATSLNPVLTVGHQIAEVLDRHCGLRGERPVSACWNCCARSASPIRTAARPNIPSSFPAA
jgi:ABC-type microcin C transport system duplicated ATPase subunit YejF